MAVIIGCHQSSLANVISFSAHMLQRLINHFHTRAFFVRVFADKAAKSAAAGHVVPEAEQVAAEYAERHPLRQLLLAVSGVGEGGAVARDAARGFPEQLFIYLREKKRVVPGFAA